MCIFFSLKCIFFKHIFHLILMVRYFTLLGSLLLLLVEKRSKDKTIFVGLPTIDDGQDKIRNYLQLVGRVLLILNFYNKIPREWNVLNIIIGIIHGILLVLIVVGYKTKLSSLALVIILTFNSLYSYSFFFLSLEDPFFFYCRHMFFQNFTVIGGLLYIVYYGPGGVSIDEKKKDW